VWCRGWCSVNSVFYGGFFLVSECIVLVLVPTLCCDVIVEGYVKCAVVWYCGITRN